MLVEITGSRQIIWVRSKNKEQEININLHICNLFMK